MSKSYPAASTTPVDYYWFSLVCSGLGLHGDGLVGNICVEDVDVVCVGRRQTPWFTDGEEACESPQGAAMGGQGLQKGSSGNAVEGESFRRRFARERHRPGESVSPFVVWL